MLPVLPIDVEQKLALLLDVVMYCCVSLQTQHVQNSRVS